MIGSFKMENQLQTYKKLTAYPIENCHMSMCNIQLNTEATDEKKQHITNLHTLKSGQVD